MSPSNHDLLGCSSTIGIDSAKESEDSESDDSLDENEEEGGDGDGPPAQILCQGVADSANKEPRSNPGMDGSLKRP